MARKLKVSGSSVSCQRNLRTAVMLRAKNSCRSQIERTRCRRMAILPWATTAITASTAVTGDRFLSKTWSGAACWSIGRFTHTGVQFAKTNSKDKDKPPGHLLVLDAGDGRALSKH